MYAAALKSFQSGRFDVAEKRCRHALAADPAHADSLHLLGLVYAATNRLDLGVETIAEAIRKNPANPEYFSNLGTLLQRQSRYDEAFKSYDLALQLRPDFVMVWIQLGDLLTKRQRFEEAVLAYDRAFALDPGNADAANRSGQILKELRRYDEALVRFEQLAGVLPKSSDTFYNIGACLCELKRPEQAVEPFRKSLELNAANVEALNGLGVAMIELKRYDEALPPLLAALKAKPDLATALGNLGLALINLKRFAEALAVLDRAIAISPKAEGLFNNKGLTLKELGHTDEALACYDRAIALKPDYADAYFNCGNCLDEMMRGEEAAACFRKAFEFKPDYAEARWNFAVNRLRAGDLRPGWIESEWRWKCPTLPYRVRKFAKPMWFGREPIEGKTLLIHNDQGLGDALQFCRYVPLAAARGACVVLEIDAPLRDLFGTMQGVSQLLVKGGTLPDFDCHCPLGSLPLAFDTTLDTIPSTVPYLSPPDDARDWQAWLGAAKGPRVGLVWSGNPKHGNDHNRSMTFATLLPLLDVDAQFISIQKDVRAGDVALLRARDDIRDAAPELKSFADTAALFAKLDLLITVDTSVAHLAGALGTPAWVLLPRLPDWRWLLDRDDSPWYPSLRLFRQDETAAWPPVIQRVKQALQEMAAGG